MSFMSTKPNCQRDGLWLVKHRLWEIRQINLHAKSGLPVGDLHKALITICLACLYFHQTLMFLLAAWSSALTWVQGNVKRCALHSLSEMYCFQEKSSSFVGTEHVCVCVLLCRHGCLGVCMPFRILSVYPLDGWARGLGQLSLAGISSMWPDSMSTRAHHITHTPPKHSFSKIKLERHLLHPTNFHKGKKMLQSK